MEKLFDTVTRYIWKACKYLTECTTLQTRGKEGPNKDTNYQVMTVQNSTKLTQRTKEEMGENKRQFGERQSNRKIIN